MEYQTNWLSITGHNELLQLLSLNSDDLQLALKQTANECNYESIKAAHS